MRKFVIGIAVLSFPLLALSACDGDGKTCKPHAIRQDVNHPEKFWVCNSRGTGEDPLSGPIPPGNPKNGWS